MILKQPQENYDNGSSSLICLPPGKHQEHLKNNFLKTVLIHAALYLANVSLKEITVWGVESELRKKL